MLGTVIKPSVKSKPSFIISLGGIYLDAVCGMAHVDDYNDIYVRPAVG